MANNYGAKNPQKFRRTDVTFHLDACCVFKEKKKGPKRSDFTKVTSSIISFIHSFLQLIFMGHFLKCALGKQ